MENETISQEEFAAMVAAHEDTAQNPFIKERETRTADTIITLPTYQKHWIEDHEQGHNIIIWSDTGKITIECRWPDKVRAHDGRVKRIKGKFDEDKD